MPTEGSITIPSRFGAKETLERVKAELKTRAIELFAEIDHAENARNAALTLRPSVVLIFGNAKAGTPLMQANQAVGLDLPLKALVWEDAGSKTWITYNDPVWIARRYGLSAEALQIAEKMRQGLDSLINSAASS
jgi:uncharacterized protein (DUF302 family)